MQIVKTLSAGRWRFSVAYRKSARSDSARSRAAKSQSSSAAQKLLNRKLSHVGLTGIVAENFADDPAALFCTLTFDSEHYPNSERSSELYEFAYKEAKLFIQRANRLSSRRKVDTKKVFVVGKGQNFGRYHIHILCSGLTGADIAALWDRGNIDYHNLSDRQDDPEKWDFVTEKGNVDPAQIAGYMIENAADATPLGRHLWHASKNCRRAQVLEASEIPDRTPIPRPEDVDVINEETRDNAYTEFRILEYIVPTAKVLKNNKISKKANRIGCPSLSDSGGVIIFGAAM